MSWIDFLLKQGSRRDQHDFGDLNGELQSARSSTVVTPLTDLGVIDVQGDDAASFLHNILTNDINGLAKDASCLAGLCNPKGRLLASMTIWPEAAGFRLVLSADLLASVHKKLSMYVLRAKLSLTDASQQCILLGLSGPKALQAISTLGADIDGTVTLRAFAGGKAIALGGDRYLLALSAEFAESGWARLTEIASPAGLDAWHWLEIVAGIPRITAKTQEEFVPQMVNYELVGGLSFTKGCYPGQEVVARSQYLGKIKRHMYRVCSDSDAVPLQVGAELFSSATEDQPCGTVVLAAPSPSGGTEALAVMLSTCFDSGDLHLQSMQGPALRFLPLPYERQTATPSP